MFARYGLTYSSYIFAFVKIGHVEISHMDVSVWRKNNIKPYFPNDIEVKFGSAKLVFDSDFENSNVNFYNQENLKR